VVNSRLFFDFITLRGNIGRVIVGINFTQFDYNREIRVNFLNVRFNRARVYCDRKQNVEIDFNHYLETILLINSNLSPESGDSVLFNNRSNSCRDFTSKTVQIT